MSGVDHSELLKALAVIESASPEVLGAVLAAAITRSAGVGRDAWRALDDAFGGECGDLDEAMTWFAAIMIGEEI